MRYILRRRDCSPTFAVGIFYAQWYHIVPTPVWSVNAPTAWLVKSNGKGGTALIS